MSSKKHIRNAIGKLGAVTALLAAATASYANTPPLLVSPCNFGKIVVPVAEKGQDYYFDQECQTGYVAPPSVGSTTTMGYQENLNVGFCPSLETTFTSVGTLEASRLLMSQKVADALALVDMTEEKRLLGISNAAKAAASVAAGIRSAATTEFGNLLLDVTSTKSDYLTCASLDLTGVPLVACADEYALFKAAADRYIAYRTSDYLPSIRADIAAKGVAQAADLAYQAERGAVEALIARAASLNDLFDTLTGRIMDVYGRYARLSGAYARVLYESNWTALVNAFYTANAGNPLLANVTWKQMPITKAELTGHSTAGTATAQDIPGIISAQVPGYPVFGTQLPNGDIPLPPPTTEAGFDYTKVFPQAFESGLTLNLLSACPMTKRTAGTMPKLDSYLVLNLKAKYELMVRTHYEATYNLYTFYQRLMSVSTSRHWFSSDTVRSFSESREAKDTWTWKYIADASLPPLGNSPEEQGSAERALEISVRQELYEHVLNNLGVGVYRTATDAPSNYVSLEPAPIGAYAQSLRWTCGFNVYSCYTGWVLGGLNALFGSNNASSNFTSANTSDASRVVTNASFVSHASNTTF